MKVYCNEIAVFEDGKEAKSFGSRFIGLMGRKSVSFEEALLFRNCSSIHCFFMKIPIDVIYLDENDVVLEVETVNPWKLGSNVKGCKHILECGEGYAQFRNIVPGAKLRFE